MTVTVIDANHCPGSVMFLFQGYFGTILHTGDFRWANGAIDLSPLDGLTVDILYLDNTYLDSRQAQFPSREEAYALLLDIVKQHPDHIIYIGVDSIGKEELLIQLARDMDMKVAVTRERYRELILMGLAGECFTTNDNEALIHVMPKERITIEFLRDANVSKPTIGILPTGWREKWASKLRAGRIFHVPYSLHSSYGEILEFMELVRPRSVRPIVLGHGDVSVLSHLLDETLPEPVRMPDALRAPSLARLAALTPIQRAPPPAFRRRTGSGSTLIVVKPEDEEDPCEQLEESPNLLELLADSILASDEAHIEEVVVKAEEEEEDRKPAMRELASDQKTFRKQLYSSSTITNAAFVAEPPPSHSHALPPELFVAPPSTAPAPPSRKRRYAHPLAAQAHAARAVLAKIGLRPPDQGDKH